jgi:hypothetical protein
MKYTLLLLTLILTTAQANLGSYKNGKFIYPDTNKPYTGNLDVINNDWGVDAVEIKFEKDGEASELAHILQGYERLVLDVIIKHSNREDIALLVHDCVVFYNKQSTDRLSQIVEQETGLRLAFSEEEY